MSADITQAQGKQVVLQNYFNLVETIAAKIKRRLPSHVDVQDLVQTGMIGLMEASGRYDSSRAAEFSTYASSRITGAILDELRRWDTCSRKDRKNARQIEHAKTQLTVKTGQTPTSEQIAEAVGLGLKEYELTLSRLESGRQPFFKAEEGASDPMDEMGRIPSSDDSPFEAYSKQEDSSLLRSHIDRLQPRYREILVLYYFKDMGLKEIGRRMGVGEARTSQLHKQAVLELRRNLDSERRSPAPRTSTMIQ
jgi:RNA polymerase sigma factor for flagellar operon FliA